MRTSMRSGLRAEQPDSVQAFDVQPTVSFLAFGITPFWGNRSPVETGAADRQRIR
jgi:hypothetical protein